MLLIPQVQLPHINFDMRELTIGEAIGLVKLNPSAHEHTISQFLACVLTGNGRALTVQERYLLVAQYISATCVGEADVSLTERIFTQPSLITSRSAPSGKQDQMSPPGLK